MYKGIVFDMDGTLIDSDQLVLKIYQSLVSAYPPIIPLSSVPENDLFAKSYVEIANQLYGTCEKKHLEWIIKVHETWMTEELKLFPGTEEMLAYLSGLPVKLYLLTSELRDIAIRELKHLGIIHYFDAIITASDLIRQKPDPEGLLKLLDANHIHPHECLFVGDQVTDAMAGKAAFIQTAMMAYRKDNFQRFGHRFDMSFPSADSLIRHVEDQNRIRTLQTDDQEIRILQLTDLHLMDEDTDALTYQGIRAMIRHTLPHLIVLTGDQTMSGHSDRLYRDLSVFMDAFDIPWTLVFGNHDTDYGIGYPTLIHAIKDSKSLMFHAGPQTLGYGHFAISCVNSDGSIKKLLVFMDTHVDQFYPIDGNQVWGYGSISEAQVDWYRSVIEKEPQSKSLVFLHIPLPEYREVHPEDRHLYRGDYLENPSTPPMDAGFFKVMADRKHTQAVFAGHDHYNDYQFVKEGIMLAYGRCSGHYDYGQKGFPKGARLITLRQRDDFHTKIILYKDIQETP